MKRTKRALTLLCLALALTLLMGTAYAASPLLRRGSRGADVKQLQGNLIYLGYLNDVADGIFGAKTEAAVRRYQSRNGLAADGIVGAQTRAKLTKEVLLLNQILDTAKSQTGFDCSGFTQYVFARAGISIPRVSRDQASAGVAVPYSQLRPGDLVCFNSPVSHVGIYLGGGKFIHSPKPGDRVKITELKYMDLTAIRRFTGVLAG